MKLKIATGIGMAILVASAVMSPVVPWAGIDEQGSSGPAESTEAHRVIEPWCPAVPLAVVPGSGGQAGYSTTWHPLLDPQGSTQEFIEVGDAWPAEHPATAAVALHECAHILQYRAYDYDAVALDEAMQQIYPDGTAAPVEHMADCMSELMGAERQGASSDVRWYTAGYGGECSEAQYAAGQRILDGKRI